MTRSSNRLLAGMYAKQARLLQREGLVEEAKDLWITAIAMLVFAGVPPTPALAPVHVRSRRTLQPDHA